jgi:hypothetical protein
MRRSVLVLFLLFPVLLLAQRRQQRFELVFSGGVATYSGDVGGNEIKFASDHLKKLGGSFGLGGRVHITNFLAVRGSFNYSMISGADSFANEAGRLRRNLSFRSPIYEGNLLLELSVFNWRHIYGHKTNLSRSGRGNLYLYAGMGFFKFNPQAYYEGRWYNLQPMGTEGQGVKEGLGKYELSSSALIAGLGYRHLLWSRYSIGFEAGIRKTNTDYLDDVSIAYYDNALIAATNGSLAATLADRSLNGERRPSGSKRGNPSTKDYYATVQLTLAVKLGDRGNDQFGGAGKKFRTRNRCFQF